MMNEQQPEWPNTEIDKRAWELAKELCAKDGITDFSKIAAKAQWVKGVLKTAKTEEK